MSELICGYTFDAIKRAQQGGRLQHVIDTSKPLPPVALSEADAALVSKYDTPEALEAAGFYGTADKLRRLKL